MGKIDIVNLDLAQLEEEFQKLNLKKFNAKQVFQWIHQKLVFDFDAYSNISKETREILKDNFSFGEFKYVTYQLSKDKNTKKFLFSLSDNRLIESVLLKYKNRYSICVSSQVGCPLKCDFCATGMMKFEKNLTASEILLQFYYLQKDLQKQGNKISNVVFMGMGEPFLNYDNVIKAINMLNSKDGQNFSKRNFTISTSGLVKEIDKLSSDEKQIGLAISLHCVFDDKRSKFMPINKVNPLDKLKKSLLNYQKLTKNRITFEYILIDDFNCENEDAKELVKFVKSFNHLVNLIPYNIVAGKSYKTPSKQKQKIFYEYLLQHGVNVTLRETKGQDIQAACGQLKVKKEVKNSEKDS